MNTSIFLAEQYLLKSLFYAPPLFPRRKIVGFLIGAELSNARRPSGGARPGGRPARTRARPRAEVIKQSAGARGQSAVRRAQKAPGRAGRPAPGASGARQEKYLRCHC